MRNGFNQEVLPASLRQKNSDGGLCSGSNSREVSDHGDAGCIHAVHAGEYLDGLLQINRSGYQALWSQLATLDHSQHGGGKLIFHIFASLAEFERALIRERTLAGLAAARARGRVGGRPKNTDTRKQAMAMSLLSDPANSVTDVCRLLKVSRSTAYRLARAGAAAAKAAKKSPASKPAAKGSSRAKKKGKAATKPQTIAATGKKTVLKAKRSSGKRKAKTK